MTGKSTQWLLQSACAAAVTLAVLASPLFAAYLPAVPDETCAQACTRWGANGFPECPAGAGNAVCNAGLVTACNTACTTGSAPVGFSCDSGQNSPGGAVTGGCVPTPNPTPGAGGCSNGCWANGACANTVCSRAPIGDASPGCKCYDKKLVAVVDVPNPVVGTE